jgi:hypothetical protein
VDITLGCSMIQFHHNKGKLYLKTLRPKTEEKKKKNQTTSTMGMYVNYVIIQPSVQDINNKKNNNSN